MTTALYPCTRKVARQGYRPQLNFQPAPISSQWPRRHSSETVMRSFIQPAGGDPPILAGPSCWINVTAALEDGGEAEAQSFHRGMCLISGKRAWICASFRCPNAQICPRSVTCSISSYRQSTSAIETSFPDGVADVPDPSGGLSLLDVVVPVDGFIDDPRFLSQNIKVTSGTPRIFHIIRIETRYPKRLRVNNPVRGHLRGSKEPWWLAHRSTPPQDCCQPTRRGH